MPRRLAIDTTLQLRLPERPSEATSYAVFDLETTGLNPSACQIIEIGWCAVRDGTAGPVRSRLVRCELVPPEVEALTGITTALVQAEGVSLEEALREFLNDTEGLALVGHNVLRFDQQFLENACAKCGLPSPHPARYRDTAALYKAQRLGMRPRPGQDHRGFAHQVLETRAPGVRYALSICCAELGISMAGIAAHRAGGDVTVTQQLYARLATSL